MKVLTVIGARPQFIKAAVVSRAIAKFNNNSFGSKLNEIIVHTGQHYDVNMSEIFFEEMKIPKPDYNLKVSGANHGAMTGRMLEKIEEVVIKENPNILLVYGDTNSTLAGALAAVKLHIPVAHVEAGLRSFNVKMPEEINRILTDRVSKWLLCPTGTAVNNLEREGVSAWSGANVYNIGDVMYDASLFYKEIAKPTEIIKALVNTHKGKFYLATVHRAENTDNVDRLSSIFNALDDISARVPVIIPLHPRSRKLLLENNITLKNLKAIEPVGYFDMITLLDNCKGVFTDSGGVQKEAYFFKKPCITLRDDTEWVELVDNGFNILVGADYNKIVELERVFMSNEINNELNLYGDGSSGDKIVQILFEASD